MEKEEKQGDLSYLRLTAVRGGAVGGLGGLSEKREKNS